MVHIQPLPLGSERGPIITLSAGPGHVTPSYSPSPPLPLPQCGLAGPITSSGSCSLYWFSWMVPFAVHVTSTGGSACQVRLPSSRVGDQGLFCRLCSAPSPHNTHNPQWLTLRKTTTTTTTYQQGSTFQLFHSHVHEERKTGSSTLGTWTRLYLALWFHCQMVEEELEPGLCLNSGSLEVYTP